ncbi:MAG: regulator of nucleoside diphosphate kinase [Pseudoalteromonas tetraodonis]|jgi:regulator of nucleoside diphosphate kinase|tara:strand:+ start:127 stop:558 length:432 start_codon:yes stop_codon:yes gene_type:complete
MIKDIKLNTKPEIIISSLDADRLYALMESLPANSFAGEKELEAELGRANIVEPHEVPSTVVTMNSTVNFVVESTGEEFTLTLVYPKNIDSSGNKISILAPVGSALLGLSQGDQIEWPKPGGGLITVAIKEVTYQPERAGELHR